MKGNRRVVRIVIIIADLPMVSFPQDLPGIPVKSFFSRQSDIRHLKLCFRISLGVAKTRGIPEIYLEIIQLLHSR